MDPVGALMRRWRLTKKIYWPGYVIVVEIGTLTDTDGEWAVGEGGGVIRLRKGLTKAQQKYTLSHEILHAAVDYNNAMLPPL